MAKDNKKQVIQSKNEVLEDTSTEKTKGEKIFVSVVIALAIIALIIVFILNIGGGGDNNKLARKYHSLDSDNVFKIINMDEFKSMIESKQEDMQVLIINNTLEDADYFIYCVNDVAKTLFKDKTVYVLDSSYLERADKNYFRNELDIEFSIFDKPNMILFDHDDDVSSSINKSVDRNSTTRYNVENFGDNYFSLLVKYFNDCDKYINK